MKKKILGVDIGGDRLKLALCKGGQVLKTVVEPTPEDLVREGKLSSPGITGVFLRETMKRHGIHASQAAVILPGEQCYLRIIAMPLMSREQLLTNLPFEFSDYITDDPENYVFDYAMEQDMRKSDDEFMEFLGVTAPRSLMAECHEMLRRAGLKMLRAAPAECALISVLRRLNGTENAERETCLIDLGYHAVHMFMFRGDRYVATRRLDVGLNRLEEALSEAHEISKTEAHEWLAADKDGCRRAQGSMDVYDSIAVELMRALNFYRFSTPDSQLEEVWLCGGGAALEPLREVLTNTLPVKVRPVNELLDSVIGENSHDFVRAVGITLE